MIIRAVLFCLAMLAAMPITGASVLAASRDINIRPAVPLEKRVALVIGNAAYADAALKNPVNDARAMAETLRALGFDVVTRENASQREMQSAVLEFGEKLSGAAVGLVYYSGHGLQVAGKNYLVPVDANITSERVVPLTTLDADTILTQMSAARARVNLVILDACRNNPFERKFHGLGRGGVAGGGLAQINAPVGTLVAYATAPGKVASDGAGAHGLYTEELLKAMRQPGLAVEDVFKHVRTAVRKASADGQTPWEASSLEGAFYFAGLPAGQNPPEVAPEKADALAVEIAFWNAIKDSQNADMFRAYLKKFPDGQFTALAKLKINELLAAAIAEIPPQQAPVQPWPYGALTPLQIPQPRPAPLNPGGGYGTYQAY